jgi:hypothetical protein
VTPDTYRGRATPSTLRRASSPAWIAANSADTLTTSYLDMQPERGGYPRSSCQCLRLRRKCGAETGHVARVALVGRKQEYGERMLYPIQPAGADK